VPADKPDGLALYVSVRPVRLRRDRGRL